MLTRNRKGLEVIEAVATLPIALLVLVAMINLGFAVYAKQAVQNAANYGARVGSTAQTCRACVAYSTANQTIRGTLVRNARVEILAPGGSVGSILKIRVVGEVPNLMGPLMSLLGGEWGGPIRVSADAVFRAEGW
ncbi:pilus assembly protein [Candidatus Kaiserbacteria bacterium]|nr:pilus assembly protein [Candidatus Kaiserbacteria bacterium]